MENIEKTLRAHLEDILGVPTGNYRTVLGSPNKEDFELIRLNEKGERITEDMIYQGIIQFYKSKNESFSVVTPYGTKIFKEKISSLPTLGVNVTYNNDSALVSVISFQRDKTIVKQDNHSDILSLAA